jgi:hypothetical protein
MVAFALSHWVTGAGPLLGKNEKPAASDLPAPLMLITPKIVWLHLKVAFLVRPARGMDQASAAGSSESDKEPMDDDAAVEAAAEARMASIHRGFAAAKAKGIPAATRLMKELRQVCLAGCFEVDLVDDNLMLWEVTLFDWVFDPSSALHRDLATISSAKSDLVAVTLRMHFPTDFPCAATTLRTGAALGRPRSDAQPRTARLPHPFPAGSLPRLSTLRGLCCGRSTCLMALFAWRCSWTGSHSTVSTCQHVTFCSTNVLGQRG